MNLPLPKETREYFGNHKNLILKTSNLYLLFNKYVYSWRNGWQMEEKDSKEFRSAISQLTFAKDYINNLLNRQKATLQSLKSSGWHVAPFTAITDSRLIIGLGGTSVIETGMTLHPLYGFPYLPGSGLKGLARAYAEIAAEPRPGGDELREVFGSEDKNPHNVTNNSQGKVFFMDGLPTTFPKLELDIMNPHYGDYYRGEKPPADYLNPVPVTFLAVAAGQKFSFAVYSRDKALAEKAKAWLIGGLTELGAGGKTNVGYGYFKDFNDVVFTTSTAVTNKPEIDKADIQKKVKQIKNPQTFTDFIKSINDDEIEGLSDISFKGMESIINIGLVGTLESAEVSAEIKKIIAQKMLEVCKEPDKKYAEKLAKYKKLQYMAGLNI